MTEIMMIAHRHRKKVIPYSLPEYTGASLPNDLRLMTQEQFSQVMDCYLKLPLDELLRRMEVGHALWKRLSAKPHLHDAVMNLNVQQGLMHCAVDRLTYPDDVPVGIISHASDLVDFYTGGSGDVGWMLQDST